MSKLHLKHALKIRKHLVRVIANHVVIPTDKPFQVGEGICRCDLCKYANELLDAANHYIRPFDYL